MHSQFIAKPLYHFKYILIIILSLSHYASWAESSAAPASRYYTLATDTPSSTAYPVGVAIATLTRIKLEPRQNTALLAISSMEPSENLQRLATQQVQAAILPPAYTEALPDTLRSIATLWLNVEHFLVEKQQVKTGTVVDLKGFTQAKFSLGLAQAERSGRYILQQLGIAADESLTAVYLDYMMSADALIRNKIKGMNIPSGIPADPVADALMQLGSQVQLLHFTDEQLRQINRNQPLWQRYIIPANTYPNQTEPVPTIAQAHFLAVHASVPATDVYWITRTLYENIELLKQIHPATQDLSLQTGLQHLTVPLHDGAIRYYQAMQVDIPDHLLTAVTTDHAETSETAPTDD